MVLVLALAAALCLGVFARGAEISEQIALRDEAVVLARNAAELLKQTGDPQQVRQQLDSGMFTLEILEENTEIPGFSQGKIVVSCEGLEVFALRTGWQEVAP